MTLRLPKDASSHCFYIRWLLISTCAHMELIKHFNMLQAYFYIKRVEFENNFGKDLFTSHACNMLWATIFYKRVYRICSLGVQDFSEQIFFSNFGTKLSQKGTKRLKSFKSALII